MRGTSKSDICASINAVELTWFYSFLRKFKATCKSSDFRNKDFWKHVQKVGRKLSLISDTEAEANDGISDVTDRAAIQVCPLLPIHATNLFQPLLLQFMKT